MARRKQRYSLMCWDSQHRNTSGSVPILLRCSYQGCCILRGIHTTKRRLNVGTSKSSSDGSEEAVLLKNATTAGNRQLALAPYQSVRRAWSSSRRRMEENQRVHSNPIVAPI